MLSSRPGVYLTPRVIDPSDPSVSDPGGPEYSAPGRPLVWPGQFVFGYARQNPNDYRQPSEQPPPATPPWARNGSFLVFRRLHQDVAGFRSFLSSQLPTLQNSGFDGLTAEAFGALLVGRWQSGVPLLRSPRSDPGSSAGLDPETNNAFNFINPFAQMKLANGHTVGAAPGDPFGVVCPFSAHIRKVNPRDSPTDFNNPSDTLTRRILRRGIPYGVEYSDPDPEKGNRGLLFVSFQTSISQQFEFLQTQWADSPVRPLGRTGNDMIIGESLDPATRTRSILLSSRPGNAITISSLNDFVIPTGGGYFFAPSRSAIKSFGSPP